MDGGKGTIWPVGSCCYWHFAFTLSGCALFAPREEVRLKQATVEELTALLSQREAAIQTMKGLFQREGAGRDHSYRVTGGGRGVLSPSECHAAARVHRDRQ